MALSDKNESRYKALEVPEFKSSLPPHILAKLPESDRHLVDMVSRMEQRDTWLINAVKDGNSANIELDVRVSKMEKWVERLTNKWSIVCYLVAIASPVLVKMLIDHIQGP